MAAVQRVAQKDNAADDQKGDADNFVTLSGLPLPENGGFQPVLTGVQVGLALQTLQDQIVILFHGGLLFFPRQEDVQDKADDDHGKAQVYRHGDGGEMGGYDLPGEGAICAEVDITAGCDQADPGGCQHHGEQDAVYPADPIGALVCHNLTSKVQVSVFIV